MARFAPAGILAGWPIQQVTSVEVSVGTDRRSFHRNPCGGWRLEVADVATTTDRAERIETALELLHNSGPQRSDLASEQLSEFGLASPRPTVTARMTSAASVTIEFGGTNPPGPKRYARHVGRREILLMPAFVAGAWEPVTGPR